MLEDGGRVMLEDGGRVACQGEDDVAVLPERCNPRTRPAQVHGAGSNAATMVARWHARCGGSDLLVLCTRVVCDAIEDKRERAGDSCWHG